jgi:predicted transcriptional regulator
MCYNSDMKKALTSMRLSQEAKDLLVKLATHLGISQTAVLELAIRQLAKQEHLKR